MATLYRQRLFRSKLESALIRIGRRSTNLRLSPWYHLSKVPSSRLETLELLWWQECPTFSATDRWNVSAIGTMVGDDKRSSEQETMSSSISISSFDHSVAVYPSPFRSTSVFSLWVRRVPWWTHQKPTTLTGHSRHLIEYLAFHMGSLVNYWQVQVSLANISRDALSFNITVADDGCVRLYQSESPKVSKAIRGLGGEVGSVIFAPRSGKNDSAVWLSVQHKVSVFALIDLLLDDVSNY